MEMSNNESILHGSIRIILPSLQERYKDFFLCKRNQTESPFMFNNLIALETSKFYQSHPSLAVRPQYPNISADSRNQCVVSCSLKISSLTPLKYFIVGFGLCCHVCF